MASDRAERPGVVAGYGWGVRREWRRLGACATAAAPDDFFPDEFEAADTALAMCRRCPVIRECRTHALGRPERHGVWGGLTESERQELLNSGRGREPAEVA